MSLNFYEDNAEQFAANTLDLDMSAVYERFLAALPEAGRILDAGCGAGRDVAAFLELGYPVEAFDASAKLVAIAHKVSGIDIQHSTFLAFESEQRFAGIWACASLLHVPPAQMSGTLRHLGQFLQPQGVMYVSFKYHDDDHQRLRPVPEALKPLEQVNAGGWRASHVRGSRGGVSHGVSPASLCV